MSRQGLLRRFGVALAAVVIVAVAYAVIGWVTLALTRYIGLAAPLWPAAGLAFAAVYRRGYHLAIGVVLGSFLANLAYGWSGIGSTRFVESIAIAAVGAGLQAIAAVALLRVVAGRRSTFSRTRQVIAFVLLSGLLAATISPTFGVLTQLWSGVLDPSAIVTAWLTWWVGDACGIIVFGPAFLMLDPEENDVWHGRRWKVALPSILTAVALLAAFLEIVALDNQRVVSEVDQLAESASQRLGTNLLRQEEVLTGIRGLELASETVTVDEFRTYTDSFLNPFTSLQAASWNPVIRSDDVASFVAGQRSQPGLADFHITERDTNGDLVPVTPRAQYVPVAYIEPVASNAKALGFDIASNPIRAEAIARARDTGRATSTAPIDLVQETGSQKGMLTLLPVYAKSMKPESVDARRAAIIGYAVGVYRLGDLVAATFTDASWDGVNLVLTDITDEPVELARRSAPVTGDGTSTIAVAIPTSSKPLAVNGRTWRVDVTPTAAMIEALGRSNIPFLLVAGLLIVGLLEAFLLLVTGMERQARREAETSNYDATHDALTDLHNRRAFLRALHATCERAEFEGTEHALLYLDLDGFKGVNDRGGHQAGDDLLREVAERMRNAVRSRDVVARLGGDEFAIILNNCPTERAVTIANTVADGVEGAGVDVQGERLCVGVSIGVYALAPGRKADVDEVLLLADSACYRAKGDAASRVMLAN